MVELLVAGSSNTDLVCRSPRLPRLGETIRGDSFKIFAGGKSANQAVAAARAGASVAFAGAVGSDPYGAARMQDLADESIDVSRVTVFDGEQSGVALIVVDQQGGNQIIYIAGANDQLSGEHVIAAMEATQPSVVLLNLEAPLETVTSALDAARPEQRIVLNCAPYDERIRDKLRLVDVLICNEIEAGELLGTTVTPESALDDAAELRALGAGTAIITLGADGAVLSSESTLLQVPALEVAAVDTTGCGDAFCGVLAAWLAGGAGLEDAARAGVIAGSLAATRAGAQASLPARDEIMERFGARG